MLITCVAYRDGKRLAEIATGEIREYLDRPDTFVWVALRDASREELAELQEAFELHPLAVEDAQHGHQRPKIEEYGESVFLVMRTVELAEDELRLGEVAVFAGRNYLLSVRSGTERGFQDVRARCEREPELLRFGPGYVLYALMDAVVDRYFPALEALEDALERTEERIFAGATARAHIEALYAIKQRLVSLKHVVGPLLEATAKLHGGRVPHLCAGLGDYFRDVYDHLIRLNQSIDSLRDMVTTAMSVHLSLLAIQENETTKRLAAYAALVAVPTMIAGVYGMNFEHMPELGWPLGYPLAVGAMAAIDAYLFVRFRRAGWL